MLFRPPPRSQASYHHRCFPVLLGSSSFLHSAQCKRSTLSWECEYRLHKFWRQMQRWRCFEWAVQDKSCSTWGARVSLRGDSTTPGNV